MAKRVSITTATKLLREEAKKIGFRVTAKEMAKFTETNLFQYVRTLKSETTVAKRLGEYVRSGFTKDMSYDSLSKEAKINVKYGVKYDKEDRILAKQVAKMSTQGLDINKYDGKMRQAIHLVKHMDAWIAKDGFNAMVMMDPFITEKQYNEWLESSQADKVMMVRNGYLNDIWWKEGFSEYGSE